MLRIVRLLIARYVFIPSIVIATNLKRLIIIFRIKHVIRLDENFAAEALDYSSAAVGKSNCHRVPVPRRKMMVKLASVMQGLP